MKTAPLFDVDVAELERQKRVEAHHEFGGVTLIMTHEQAHELSMGRVPDLVQEMAKWAVEPTQEWLRRNAAKPVNHGRNK